MSMKPFLFDFLNHINELIFTETKHKENNT